MGIFSKNIGREDYEYKVATIDSGIAISEAVTGPLNNAMEINDTMEDIDELTKTVGAAVDMEGNIVEQTQILDQNMLNNTGNISGVSVSIASENYKLVAMLMGYSKNEINEQVISNESNYSMLDRLNASTEGLKEFVTKIIDAIMAALNKVSSLLRTMIPKLKLRAQGLWNSAGALKTKVTALKLSTTDNKLTSESQQRMLKSVGLWFMYNGDGTTVPADSAALKTAIVNDLTDAKNLTTLNGVKDLAVGLVSDYATASVTELSSKTHMVMHNNIRVNDTIAANTNKITSMKTMFKDITDEDDVMKASLLVSSVIGTTVNVIALAPKTETAVTTEGVYLSTEVSLSDFVAGQQAGRQQNNGGTGQQAGGTGDNTGGNTGQQAGGQQNNGGTGDNTGGNTGQQAGGQQNNGGTGDNTGGNTGGDAAKVPDVAEYTPSTIKLELDPEKAKSVVLPGLIKTDILAVLSAMITNNNKMDAFLESITKVVDVINKKVSDLRKINTTDITGNEIDGVADKIKYVTKIAGLIGTTYVPGNLKQRYALNQAFYEICELSYEALAENDKVNKK